MAGSYGKGEAGKIASMMKKANPSTSKRKVKSGKY